jgi:glyoxylase-like metal-dependent hydrolase (beta-lactamase superfamily II)
MILKTLVVGPYGANCYIVGSESTKRGIIIDPGAESKSILNEVDKLGLSIIWIVITHSHFDHIGALKAVKDATGAKIALHEAEGEGAGQDIAQVLGSMITGSISKPARPDKLLKDGDIIDIDDLHFTVLHTPGHSRGGISLVGHGVVFSGDTLFNLSIGRTDFPGCSHTQLIDSIHKKLMALPDATIVYPGHGPESTIGTERRMNPFLRG